MHQAELCLGVADVGVTVEDAGNTVGSPSSVSHRCLTKEDFVHINSFLLDSIGYLGWQGGRDGVRNVLSERSDLGDLLEGDEWSIRTVAVDSNT